MPYDYEQEKPNNKQTEPSAPPWSMRPILYLSTVLIFAASLLMSGGSFPLFCIEFTTLALLGFFLHALANRYVFQESSKLFSGSGNSLIFTLGIVIPTISFLLFAGFTLPNLWHVDASQSIETGFWLALMPLSNFIVFRTKKQGADKRPRVTGIVNGVGLAVSLIGSLICFGALLDSRSFGAACVLIPYLCAAPPSLLAAALLNFDLWTKADKTKRQIISPCSFIGIALAFVLIFAPNFKGYALEALERIAEEGLPDDQPTAVSMLRTVASESDLKGNLQSSNFRLGPLLFPCNVPGVSEDLYFRITGKPYPANWNNLNQTSTTRDPGSTLIGNKISGLSLAKSRLTGAVDSRSLSASLDWTFIFKNNSAQDQEAKAHISIPPGAVISRLTLWINGQPHEAAFSSTAKTTEAYTWIVERHRDPVLVTMCSPDTALVQCSPVPAKGGEMKLRIGFKNPVEEQANEQLAVVLPGLLDSNFGRPTKHYVDIKSSSAMVTEDPSSDLETHDGNSAFDYSMPDKPDSRSIGSINVQRGGADELLATPDWYSHGRQFVVERIKQNASLVPTKLCVVIDQSSALTSKIGDIKESLQNIPAEIKTSIFFAKDNPQQNVPTPLTVNEAKQHFETAVWAGGQDNSAALKEALESASGSKKGAVLWIHGPQPYWQDNSELNVLELTHAPALYDFEVESGTNRLLKSMLDANFQNISSYKKVYCQTNTLAELNKLFSDWKTGAKRLEVVRWTTTERPKTHVDYDRTVSAQLTCLWAKEEVERLLRRGLTQKAEVLASNYRLVTPVTGAVVLERESDYATKNLDHGAYLDAPDHRRSGSDAFSSGDRDAFSSEGPSPQGNSFGSASTLQGATNGTIGPQMDDSTFVTGVNTAGTVRINNLSALNLFDRFTRDANLFCDAAYDANPEGTAVLNALTLICLCLCLPSGLSMIVFSVRESIRQGRNAKKLALLGTTLVAAGLIGPVAIFLGIATR